MMWMDNTGVWIRKFIRLKALTIIQYFHCGTLIALKILYSLSSNVSAPWILLNPFLRCMNKEAYYPYGPWRLLKPIVWLVIIQYQLLWMLTQKESEILTLKKLLKQ